MSRSVAWFVSAVAASNATPPAISPTSDGNATSSDGARAVDLNLNELSLDSTVTNIPKPRTLESLPAELKLKILSNLPIREVPNLVNINGAFRALIEEHENTIIQTSIASSLGGFNNFINTHISYPVKTINGESTFMTVLTALINLRGLVAPSLCFEILGLLEQFIGNWRHSLALANGIKARVATVQERAQNEADFHASLEDETYEMDPFLKAFISLTELHFHYHMKGYEIDPEDITNQRKSLLDIVPESVGLQSTLEMEAIILEIENGAWVAAKVFPQCPITCCLYSTPQSSFGIYAKPHWTFSEYDSSEDDDSESDTDDSESESEKVDKKALEEQQRAANAERIAREEQQRNADAEDGWTVVGPSRRNKKKLDAPGNDSQPVEQAPSSPENQYRESLLEADRAGYGDIMDRPFLFDRTGIDYDSKNLETLDVKFQRLFGVPSLSEKNMPFRYFVQSEWAYNLVKAVLHGESELGLWDKAAVLEELYVY